MELVNFMAKACHYAQEHIDDARAWSTDPSVREGYLQCVSYQMACFFAQNTPLGEGGVEWDVALKDLIEHPMKSEKKWEQVFSGIAKQLGGWTELVEYRLLDRACFERGCMGAQYPAPPSVLKHSSKHLWTVGENQMSPDNQRIAIAEACGWALELGSDTQTWWTVKPDGSRAYGDGPEKRWPIHVLPNYLNDLNAMREAEKVLGVKLEDYWGELAYICERDFKNGASRLNRNSASATATQRAEAFLHTLNLYK